MTLPAKLWRVPLRERTAGWRNGSRQTFAVENFWLCQRNSGEFRYGKKLDHTPLHMMELS